MKFKKLVVLGSVVASMMVMSQSAFADVECTKKRVPGTTADQVFCKETKKS